MAKKQSTMDLLDEIERVIQRAKDNGVTITAIHITPTKCVDIACKVTMADIVRVGLSKHDANKYRFSPQVERELREALLDDSFNALG